MFHSTQAISTASRIPRLTLCLGLLLSLSTTSPAAPPDESEEEQASERSAFPTLNILPEGSILRRVRLPRYDENFQPRSLLEAEQLTVINKGRIQAEDVAIELYADDGSLQARTKMRTAIYDQTESTLHAKEAIYIKGTTYVASGTGLIFHWNSRKGFLQGPASTKYYFEKKTTSHMHSTPSPKSPLKATALAGSLMLVSTSIPAAHAAENTQQIQSQTAQAIKKENTISNEVTNNMRPFLKQIGKDNLLVKTPANPSNVATIPPQPNQTSLLVECDGGLYFDNDTGVLAYLKNIRLTEDRFNLTCSDELKVILEKKSSTKTDSATNTQPEDSIGSFGEISRIVAKGTVQLTRKDDQGRLFIASGETASYNAKTGEMILRGGRPRLQQSKNQYLQAQEDGQWIRVSENGKLITSRGKWKMLIVRNPTSSKP